MYEQHNKMCVSKHGFAAQQKGLQDLSIHYVKSCQVVKGAKAPFSITKTKNMKSDLLIIHDIVRSVYDPPKQWNKMKTRKRVVCVPIQAAHWACYYYTRITTSEIAFHFGRKAHGNVLHSVTMINNMVKIDYEYACKINAIKEALVANGFELLFPDGRSVLTLQKYTIQTEFKQRPARVFKKTPKPKPEHISPFTTLQALRNEIKQTENIEDVVLLSKEIKRLESIFDAVQHKK